MLLSLYRVGDARANRASSMEDDEMVSVKIFLLCLVLSLLYTVDTVTVTRLYCDLQSQETVTRL